MIGDRWRSPQQSVVINKVFAKKKSAQGAPPNVGLCVIALSIKVRLVGVMHHFYWFLGMMLIE